MKEIPFKVESSNKQMIYGIEHHPLTVGNNYMIVFIHGWAGYRTGPHDMLINIARHLSNIGFSCIRFDFRGRGYSQGDKDYTNELSMLDDLQTILDYVNKKSIKYNLILLGICSGAKIAIFYAKNGTTPIDKIIVLSPPPLKETSEVVTKLVRSEVTSILSILSKKIVDKQTWILFFKGEINFRRLINSFLQPFYRLTRIDRNKKLLNKKNSKVAFNSFRGDILLIYGEKDPATSISLLQMNIFLQHYTINYTVKIIEDANHSFYSVKWKKQIIEEIDNWLNITTD